LEFNEFPGWPLKEERLLGEANDPSAPLHYRIAALRLVARERLVGLASIRPVPFFLKRSEDGSPLHPAEAGLQELEDARSDESEEVRFWADLALKETRFASGL
jgi:hypothetical protein